MNWQLSDGRIECTHGGLVNEVHALTHQLVEGDGDFQMRAKVGLMDRMAVSANGVVFAGFKFGAVGHRNDYRSNIYYDIESGFAEELMQELPLQAGITSDGRLVINSRYSDPVLSPDDLKECQINLEVSYAGNVATIRLTVDRANGETATLESQVERESLVGNVALACHPLTRKPRKRHDHSDPDHATFWFSDWSVSGNKFKSNPEQTYGPILWTQYTLDNQILKLMAFFVPMEEEASQVAKLQTRSNGKWNIVAESLIDPLSLTANFRVENWDDSVDQEYRVIYEWKSVDGSELAQWSGTIRKNPKDKDSIVLAGLTCSHAELFPNRFFEENLLEQNPDILYFAGDQVYETCGGYGIVVAKTESEVPRATLNYLGKFWPLGLSFRELLKDRPSVMIPDDHDVYSNDLWGKEGAAMPTDATGADLRCFGGYRMHPEWVRMVEHTQMGHHPDPFDPTPVQQGIQAYYTSLDVGGVSFALINDRKFKSAPGDVIDAMEPLFKMRGERNLPLLDVIEEENFDTTTLDRDDLQLLGKRQLDFLRQWGSDGKKLRAVLSQSPYCQPHHLMVADFDSNGWPQSGRKRALEVIRDANAVMIHGDLHFATLVQQGIDDWEDAGWSFTLPALITGTRRLWTPKVDGENRQPSMPDYTGRFLDGWGNKITMWAAANPFSFLIEDDYEGEGRATLDYLRNKGLGYGIVRFNKAEFTVTFESWPVYGRFKGAQAHEQHPGFPKTVNISFD
ncbi:MAG: alkaline phosphatase D family protein, partial [Verrucomicrobia bacterium]|nr:alkaline phosphatase D family protein [Verrucomicrobiota bacterium]